MIRDPSDGTVREPPKSEVGIHMTETDMPVSGLPATSQKPKHIERLEASREWLKTYHAKKGSIE